MGRKGGGGGVSIPRYNHSFYICIPYLKILACTVPVKTDTNLALKDRKMDK